MKVKDRADERRNVKRVVRIFARRLEARLMEPKNARKGGWRSMADDEVMYAMRDEVRELSEAFGDGPGVPVAGPVHDAVMKESLDVAAFAAFFMDPRRAPGRWRRQVPVRAEVPA